MLRFYARGGWLGLGDVVKGREHWSNDGGAELESNVDEEEAFFMVHHNIIGVSIHYYIVAFRLQGI